MAPFFNVLLQMSQVVMAPLSTLQDSQRRFGSQEHSVFAIGLLMRPIFNLDHKPSQALRLSVSMTLELPQLNFGDTLFTLPLMLANVPSQQYDNDSIRVSDEYGLLDLEIRDKGNERLWIVQRAAVGIIIATFDALPRVTDTDTPPGPRIDLREQFGGLLGAGSTFLPLPPDRDSTFRFTLQWDLSQSPKETRTVWSFGEGVGPITRSGTLSVVRDSIYGAGPLQSLIDSSVDPSGDVFNIHWFGNPEFDVVQLGKDMRILFTSMSNFFGDIPSKANPYRIFLRHSPRGQGGTAFQRSFIYEYDKDVMRLEHTIFPLLTHEMVHNWPLLGKETDGSDEELDTSDESWYSEGIAVYYQMMLPYRFGLRGKDYLINQINSYLSGYYTNPAIAMTNREASEASWKNSNAGRIRYERGFIYLLITSVQLRENSQGKGKTSLDEIVYELLERKRNGLSYKLKDWLSVVKRELGQFGVDEYYEMASGKLVIPPPDFLTSEYGLRLVRKDQEVLELGFDAESYSRRLVTGVKQGTRAEQAGLKDGDKIIESSFTWEFGNDISANMNMLVQRPAGPNGKEIRISYWPRSHETVECYQVIEI